MTTNAHGTRSRPRRDFARVPAPGTGTPVWSPWENKHSRRNNHLKRTNRHKSTNAIRIAFEFRLKGEHPILFRIPPMTKRTRDDDGKLTSITDLAKASLSLFPDTGDGYNDDDGFVRAILDERALQRSEAHITAHGLTLIRATRMAKSDDCEVVVDHDVCTPFGGVDIEICLFMLIGGRRCYASKSIWPCLGSDEPSETPMPVWNYDEFATEFHWPRGSKEFILPDSVLEAVYAIMRYLGASPLHETPRDLITNTVRSFESLLPKRHFYYDRDM
jgi:hypothetical protein